MFRKGCLVVAGCGILAAAWGLAAGLPRLWSPAATLAAVGLAIGVGEFPKLRSYQFTGWIVAAVVAAMVYPSAFSHWGRFDLSNRWAFLIVLQVVMFGMGTQMSLRDFAGVIKTPRGVLVGVFCHFTVMPLVAFALIRIFRFPAEIAAGVILIGSCSSGLASNVMAYIARANLALSVTVTAVATMLAPLLTPLLMKLLAGTLVEVRLVPMMIDIVKIVVVPIGAALIHDYLRRAPAEWRRRIFAAAAAAAVAYVGLAAGGWTWIEGRLSGHLLELAGLGGFVLSVLPIGAGYHWVASRLPRLDSLAPVASMVGTVYFTAVTTAAGRDNLLKVGLLLFLATAIHNAAGYGCGYWLARGAGLDRNSSRSVAFEVGLQNAALASGLASAMSRLGTVGMAPAIFGPWMNFSGSLLANFWQRRPAAAPSVDPVRPAEPPA